MARREVCLLFLLSSVEVSGSTPDNSLVLLALLSPNRTFERYSGPIACGREGVMHRQNLPMLE